MDRHYPTAAPRYPSRTVAALFCAIAVFASAASATPTDLKPVRAEYAVTIKGMTAHLDRSLRPLGNHRWIVESNSSLLFFRILERSEFRLDDGVVRPLSYLIERTGGGDRNQNVVFDWDNLVARNTRREAPWEFKLLADHPVLDQLSLQIQLRSDLLSDRFDSGKQYEILDRGRVKTYIVESRGEERITLPSGTSVNARKLKQFREGKDRYTLVWLLPESNYVIARLQHHDDDEVTNLVLRSAVIGGQILE